MASFSTPVAPKIISITHDNTISTEKIVQYVRRSFRTNAAKMQAIRGVRLHTTPVVLTEKYFIALYEIMIERVV